MDGADTIVAVSTPAGYSPRAVVRLSGPGAVACAAARFRARDDGRGDWRGTFRATPGEYTLKAEGLSLPAVLYVMRAPHSYTREDVVEVHVPGSPALLDMMLDDLASEEGVRVRLAGPGEFTRRAFMNGRIDLSQAEAVLALIRARSEAELAAATTRLQGGAARRCAALQERVTDLRAHVEAALDFAEQGIELLPATEFAGRCRAIRREMAEEIGKGREQIATGVGVHVAICGPPNAGKSSLLNRLAEAEKAIVHPAAGTTRDAVEVEVELAGVYFRLTDTAGLAEGASGVEAEAVRRARRYAASCDLLMLVLDGSAPLEHGATRIARQAPRERVLCVINKCDLPQVIGRERPLAEPFAWETLHVSALTGEGMAGLQEALGRTVSEGRLDASACDCLFNARQRNAVRRALDELREAGEAVAAGMGYEFAAFNLRRAADALGEITGRVEAQDVLDRIFSQFCIGK